MRVIKTTVLGNSKNASAPTIINRFLNGICLLKVQVLSEFPHAKKAHKKLVATASRREGVYKRTGKPSVTFCERGEARKRADDFFAQKTSKQSELCFDVVRITGLEPA